MKNWIAVALLSATLAYGQSSGGNRAGTGAGSSSWSVLTAPSQNLSLAMAAFNSTFTTTTANATFFNWKNTTAALVGTSQGSPVLNVCGRAFHGSADVEDCMTLSTLPGNGNDAAIAFNIGHTGTSTGAVTTSFPGPLQAGTFNSIGAGFALPEGTVATATTGQDTCYADSTLHGIKCNMNNANAGAFNSIAIGQFGQTTFGAGTAVTVGTAGGMAANEGTAPTAVPAVGEMWNDSAAHEWKGNTNGGGSGLILMTRPGSIRSTGLVALVSTATLCAASAGACNQAGQYHIHWNFYESGTACGTPGTGGVTFLLTWTDGNGTTHSAISLSMDDSASLVATSATFTFRTTLAAAWATGDFNIDTNGSIIQYATGYTACSVGTGTYALSAVVTRLQ